MPANLGSLDVMSLTARISGAAKSPFHQREAGLAVLFCRNVSPGLFFFGQFAQSIGVVGAIGEQDGAFAHALQHRLCHPDIVSLPCCQTETDRSAVCIDDRMDLRRQAAAGTSHAAIVSIPLFPVAAC